MHPFWWAKEKFKQSWGSWCKERLPALKPTVELEDLLTGCSREGSLALVPHPILVRITWDDTWLTWLGSGITLAQLTRPERWSHLSTWRPFPVSHCSERWRIEQGTLHKSFHQGGSKNFRKIVSWFLFYLKFRETEMDLSSTDSPARCPELNPGVPCAWQGPKHLNH